MNNSSDSFFYEINYHTPSLNSSQPEIAFVAGYELYGRPQVAVSRSQAGLIPRSLLPPRHVFMNYPDVVPVDHQKGVRSQHCQGDHADHQKRRSLQESEARSIPRNLHPPPPRIMNYPAAVPVDRQKGVKRPHGHGDHADQPKRRSLPESEEPNEQITRDITQHFHRYRPPSEIFETKRSLTNTIFKMITESIGSVISLPEQAVDLGLFMVGSTTNGFGTRTSDLDLCLMINQHFEFGKDDAIEILKNIRNLIRRIVNLRNIQLIPARVPILKFVCTIPRSRDSFECDLNINNPIGIRNTHLLNMYSRLDPRVQHLMLAIKRWARFQDINDASKKTISSYSYSLMLIFYLQAGVSPPVLPCLHHICPDEFSKNLRELSPDTPPPGWVTLNESSTGELFLGFLEYYQQFSFDKWCISARSASLLTKEEAMANSNDPRQWKCISIEEPFDLSNTARSVYDDLVFQRILRVLRRSFEALSRTRKFDAIVTDPF